MAKKLVENAASTSSADLKSTASKSAGSKSVSSKASTSKIRTKLFVLDTNVLMHDPSSLFRFEEHDIYLPMVTLEELDNNKKGVTEVARNARQASRYLEEIVGTDLTNLELGCPLAINGNKHLAGRLFLQTSQVGYGRTAI